MKKLKKEKAVEIEIQEEVQLPGTDIVLEAGDKIEVLKERNYSSVSHSDDEIEQWVNGMFDSFWDREIKIRQTNYADQYANQNALEIEAAEVLLKDLQNALAYLLGGKVEIDWRS